MLSRPLRRTLRPKASSNGPIGECNPFLPGFAADCLETLEEIAEENKEIFVEHGGDRFTFIPCLNDSEGGIRVLLHLIERELKGWV